MSKTFEEMILELEKIVKELEEGNLPLDESIAKFKKGIELSKLCDEKLKEAQKAVVEKVE